MGGKIRGRIRFYLAERDNGGHSHAAENICCIVFFVPHAKAGWRR